MFECIFTNGSVIDGTGKRAFSADVGVVGGEIEAVGDLGRAESKRRVDCTGLVVCPGFIDPHSHVDMYVLLFPQMESFIYQGITTVVNGNCGFSALPSSRDCRAHIGTLGTLDQLDDVPYEWDTVGGYYDALEDAGIGVNIGQLVGHGPLRTQVMGLSDNRLAGKEDLEKMASTLDSQLSEGALGMSIGRGYPPGRYADESELVELCKICASHGAVHAQHVKLISSFEGMEEFLSIALKSGCRSQMAHFCPQTREDLEKGNKMFEDAAKRGPAVTYTFLNYPTYTLRSDALARNFGCTLGMHHKLRPKGETGDVLPAEGYKRFRQALNDPEMVKEFKRIMVEADQYAFPDYFDAAWANEGTVAANAGFGEPPARTLGEISKIVGKNRVDTMWHLIFGDGPPYNLSCPIITDEMVRELMRHPQAVPNTDSNYRWSDLYDRGGNPWPVSHGAFARYFRMAREIGMPLEEAVYKVTGLSAETFNIGDRGYLRKGQAADIAVFSSEKFQERATDDAPFEMATGMRYVMVNGQFVMFDYDLTGVRAGKGLRRG